MKKEQLNLAKALVDICIKNTKVILIEERLTSQYNKGYKKALEDALLILEKTKKYQCDRPIGYNLIACDVCKSCKDLEDIKEDIEKLKSEGEK